MPTAITATVGERVDALDWDALRDQLDSQGHAITAPLLDGAECDELAELFDGGSFRATIDMARHRFGDGRYRYFDHPLPEPIAALRASFYRQLAPIANDWAERLRGESRAFPLEHEELLERCRAAGQERPDAADPALRRGRLERAAPGPLRRRLLPVPDPHDPVRAGGRLRRRRVRADGAAPARAEPRACAQAAAGRVRDLPDPRSARTAAERLPPGRHAPRRRHRHARAGAPRSASSSTTRSELRALDAVLGDPRPQVGGALTNGTELRVVAEAAAMTHRVCVLPGRDQGLELRS